jgi:hypothetical protein
MYFRQKVFFLVDTDPPATLRLPESLRESLQAGVAFRAGYDNGFKKIFPVGNTSFCF